MNTRFFSKKMIIGASIITILALVMIVISLQKIGVDNSVDTNSVTQVKIGQHIYAVDVAQTNEARIKGLSDRKELLKKHGLLFIFNESQRQGFWMKDMNFSIDIIWIDEYLKVVGIERNVSPDTFPEIFYSPESIRYVLEVNSGEASMLIPGDTVEFFSSL